MNAATGMNDAIPLQAWSPSVNWRQSVSAHQLIDV